MTRTRDEILRHIRDLENEWRMLEDASMSSPHGCFAQGIPSGNCDSDGHYMCDECKEKKPLR